MYTISEVAKLLKVDKKTLMRWDKAGKFPAERDSNNFRVYDEKVIHDHVLWFVLRRKHKDHLRKVKPLRNEMDRFVRTTPLTGADPTPTFDIAEMSKAYDAMKEWTRKNKDIRAEYTVTPRGRVSPEN